MHLYDIIKESAVQGLSDQRQVDYFTKATKLLKSKLGISKELVVTFKPPYDLDPSQHGACVALGENPAKIFILIDGNKGLSNNEMLLALCHEMIHAHQFARGDLKILELKGNKFKGVWQGEEIIAKYSRSNPWEVEAHKDERPLMMEIIDELGNLTL